NVGSVEVARAAVRAVYYPPRGEREFARPLRFRALSNADYLEWANTQLILSCQIEGSDGLENYREIVRVEGIDCIQTGRGDISLALGLPGEELHPKVLEAEKRVVLAALEAGKEVSLLHALTPDGIERTMRWIEQGVRILTVDSDARVLLREYAASLEQLRRKE
ncbi:MAG: aldolase/citrate lyase family protein, partial [Chloroflexota bacterium]